MNYFASLVKTHQSSYCRLILDDGKLRIDNEIGDIDKYIENYEEISIPINNNFKLFYNEFLDVKITEKPQSEIDFSRNQKEFSIEIRLCKDDPINGSMTLPVNKFGKINYTGNFLRHNTKVNDVEFPKIDFLDYKQLPILDLINRQRKKFESIDQLRKVFELVKTKIEELITIQDRIDGVEYASKPFAPKNRGCDIIANILILIFGTHLLEDDKLIEVGADRGYDVGALWFYTPLEISVEGEQLTLRNHWVVRVEIGNDVYLIDRLISNKMILSLSEWENIYGVKLTIQNHYTYTNEELKQWPFYNSSLPESIIILSEEFMYKSLFTNLLNE